MHNDPFPLEEELRLSMRRMRPPDGFAAGVFRRLASEQPLPPAASRSPAFASLRTLHRLAAMLLLVLLIPLGNSLYQRHQQARAEKAAKQFALAMRLTHAAMLDAGQQVFDHRHGHSSD